MFFAGCCFAGGILLGTYAKLFNSKDSDKIQENNLEIPKIPYNYPQVTHSMLNDKENPYYVGDILESQKRPKKEFKPYFTNL